MTKDEIERKIKSIVESLQAAIDDLEGEDADDFGDSEDQVRGALTHAEIGVNELKRFIGQCNSAVWQ